MESFFFHPKVVHFPIALGVLMPLVSAVLVLAWWRGWLPARAWALAVGLQALLLISGFTAIRSGGAEEEMVERVVDGRFIHEHEEAAEGLVWASGIVLAIMVLSLATAKKRGGLPLAGLSVIGTLVVLALAFRTGDAGGNLVYKYGAAVVHVQPGAAAGQGEGSHEDHDHD
jgi:uncharacterized membrane protein